MNWRWIDASFAVAVHDQQLATHGGGTGIRDQGMLDSALARPKNLAAYGEPDVPALAASYAFGIARNHPFVDGNKRTALVVCETFLVDNGYSLLASDAELAVLFEALAGGKLGEDELAQWFRERAHQS
ncbi:type II toxin-antitoxin system death-on-curing family toxin [Sphingomonas sp.]|uniref:type II toxin-antitoxin system death-on-curing family toxin n=1 Tax=Sphingomonas sp. TaxID=28214 RepID=UPI00389BA91D